MVMVAVLKAEISQSFCSSW